MHRVRAALISIVVLLAGCSSDDAATVETETSAGGTSRTSGAQLEAETVIGRGRATQASSSTGLDGVVATTIGVNAIDQDGAGTEIPTGVDLPARDVVLAPDGKWLDRNERRRRDASDE